MCNKCFSKELVAFTIEEEEDKHWFNPVPLKGVNGVKYVVKRPILPL